MKFLIEHNESHNLELLTEDSGKDLFIRGIFAEADQRNRNGRIYPKLVMESALNTYKAEFVSKKRALGELSHPAGRPQVKPELASHLITELNMVGNNVIGKAKILNTPQGNIVRGLLEGGVQLGVSTRALGSVRESNGNTYVEPDLVFLAVDIVSDPSAINAFVTAVNESCEWLVTDSGQILEQVKKVVDNKPFLTESQKLKLFSEFMQAISVKN